MPARPFLANLRICESVTPFARLHFLVEPFAPWAYDADMKLAVGTTSVLK